MRDNSVKLSLRLMVTITFSMLFLWTTGCRTDAWVGEQRATHRAVLSTHAESTSAVFTSNVTEDELVEELIRQRALYARYLQALGTFYTDKGFIQKAAWAEQELTELRRVPPYRYLSDGVELPPESSPERARGRRGPPVVSLESPPGVVIPPIPIADRTEIDLVEELVLHRSMYARFLNALGSYYLERGPEYKVNWVREEQRQLGLVKPYPYIMEASVPPPDLRPTDSIAEADKLYEDALTLMRKAGHGVPIWYHAGTMKHALAKLKVLIEQYPTSDKIDDAAFYIGEIHKEYGLGDSGLELDNELALKWYQRAIDWDPKTPHPVRFQMAVVLDYRLHERERALAMYQRVLAEEADLNRSNTHWASVRIGQLTREETRHAPGDTVSQERYESEPFPMPAEGSLEQ
ncbi:MAG: hypothetical protein GXY44_09535 [Phycisphaerales bacterium]|nr:hypothetical protein [Phycisphaerales bacterium]